jgi:hypothetical protein
MGHDFWRYGVRENRREILRGNVHHQGRTPEQGRAMSALPPNLLQNSASERPVPKSGQFQNLKRRFLESKFPIQDVI